MIDMPRQFLTSQNNQLFSKQRYYSRCKEHSSRQEEFILVSTRVQGNFLKCRWLNGVVTPRADKPDKIVPDGARPKNGWFYLASWTRNLQDTWRKLSRLCQTAPEFPFVYKKRQNLVLSGTIWPTSLQTSGAGSQIEPAIFLSGSVWLRLAWFCLVRLVLV